MRSPRANRSLRALAVAVAAVTFAACGGDDGGESSPDPTSSGTTATTAPVATTTGDSVTTPTTGAGPDTSAPGTSAAPGTTGDGPEPVRGGELVVGGIFDAFGLEPATFVGSVTDGHISNALYDTLMTYTPEGVVEPWLAESMETTDQQHWTIKLREGVLFQDGTPLDAEAVKFNLERHRDPALKSRQANNSKNIASITVVDPLTLELELVFPWASFDEILVGNLGLMASPTAVAAGTINDQPVGTGPFRLVERVQGDRLVVERNENYWREGEPYLDRIVYRVILDDSVRQSSVEAGEIQASQSILGDVLAAADDAEGIKSTQSPGHANTIHMNTLTGPTADVRVRQALAHAIDYDALNDVVFDGAAPADGHFIGDQNPYFDADVAFPTYDLDAAKALIEEYEAENGPVSFTFSCYTGGPQVQMTQLVSQMWTAAGADVEVQLGDQASLVLDMLQGNFSVGCLALGAESVDPDLIFYNQLHSASTSNYGKYANPEMDAALLTGRTSSDEAERREAYSTVQTLLARDIPTIEWIKSPWGWIVEDRVHGLESLPASEFHPSLVFLAD